MSEGIMAKRAVFLVPLSIFLALVVFFVLALKRDEQSRELPSALIGEEVKPFDLPSVFEDPETGFPSYRVTDADLKQGEVTVVNFWASWCGPCKIEHPQLLHLKQSGMRLLGMNYKDEAEDALRFLEEMGDPFTLIASDAAGRVGIDWGITGVPETFVVDGQGRIVVKFIGPLTAVDVEKIIRPAIDKAQAQGEKPAAAPPPEAAGEDTDTDPPSSMPDPSR